MLIYLFYMFCSSAQLIRGYSGWREGRRYSSGGLYGVGLSNWIPWHSDALVSLPVFCCCQMIKPVSQLAGNSLIWSESRSVVSDSVTQWIIPSMEFSRPEHWSGLPFISPGDLPNLGIEPRSPAFQEDSLPTELSEEPPLIWTRIQLQRLVKDE